MKKIILVILGILVILIMASIFIVPKDKKQVPEKITAAATIFPLYDIAREIAGEAADIKLILPPSASPHVFEFSPRRLAELQDTRIIFAIGHGLDNWAGQIQNAAPNARLVTVDKNIKLRSPENEEEHEERGESNRKHGPIDPHYWLNFQNAAAIADNIAAALSEIDPSSANHYRVRSAAYKEKLSAKEQELKTALAEKEKSPILTFHDAWFYFAENFNIEIAGEFEPSVAEEPSPRYLAELGRVIKEKNIRVIFSEPQFSSEKIRAFAAENNLKIAELDPIGGIPGRMSYVELMEHNALAVRNALD